MSEFSMPMDLRVLFSCDLCGNNLEERQVNVRVAIGNDKVVKLKLCDDCIKTRLNITTDKLNFLRALLDYRKCNKIRYKDLECWNKECIIIFIKYLKFKKIEIKDYGIEICHEWKNGECETYGLMELIKLYKIKI